MDHGGVFEVPEIRCFEADPEGGALGIDIANPDLESFDGRLLTEVGVDPRKDRERVGAPRRRREQVVHCGEVVTLPGRRKALGHCLGLFACRERSGDGRGRGRDGYWGSRFAHKCAYTGDRAAHSNADQHRRQKERP